MSTLAVIILTKNEENNILDCLESIRSLDEIIIVDDYSEDRTLELIQNYSSKLKIYKRHLEGDFSEQRNFGLSKATSTWVMFLDADERLSKDLLSEINSQIVKNKADGFLIGRQDFLWGKKLVHGETGSIKLLRLARRNMGKWTGKVHEVWDIQGKIGVLNNALMHYPHQTVSEFLSEISMYSTVRANELSKAGTRVSAMDVLLYPLIKFLLNYFVKQGYRDGLQGLVVALMMSFHSFLVRGKLWLLQNEK